MSSPRLITSGEWLWLIIWRKNYKAWRKTPTLHNPRIQSTFALSHFSCTLQNSITYLRRSCSTGMESATHSKGRPRIRWPRVGNPLFRTMLLVAPFPATWVVRYELVRRFPSEFNPAKLNHSSWDTCYEKRNVLLMPHSDRIVSMNLIFETVELQSAGRYIVAYSEARLLCHSLVCMFFIFPMLLSAFLCVMSFMPFPELYVIYLIGSRYVYTYM